MIEVHVHTLTLESFTCVAPVGDEGERERGGGGQEGGREREGGGGRERCKKVKENMS